MIDALENPGSAAFFEIVRLLQAKPRREHAIAVGHQGPPSREAVRFRPALDLSFGVSEVDGCRDDVDHERTEVTCRFFGLYGAASPLPACYTELLLYDDPNGLLRDFLDIFNHRLLSFFYRAWEKYRHHVQYDGSGEDVMSRRVRTLCHLEQKGEPMSLLAFAGVLHQQPLSEGSIEQILSQSLRVPVQVRSCHVRWIDVPEHQRSSLGQRNCVLGGLAPLGRELRSATTTFEVHVGPVPQVIYADFLPGGARRRSLGRLLDRLNVDELDCLLSVEITPEHAYPYRLGNQAGGLGWTTWLGADAPRLAHSLGDTVSHTLYRSSEEGMVA